MTEPSRLRTIEGEAICHDSFDPVIAYDKQHVDHTLLRENLERLVRALPFLLAERA